MVHGSTTDERTVPEIRFAQARGARIAYQDYGHGPAVVCVPPFAQNLEVAWEDPALRYMLERFGSFSRWIPFDKRGTGASDRRITIAGLDERVEDMRAVMDEAGVDRAFVFGASEGGPMCLLFAATYPHRVNGVILNGSGAYIAPPVEVDAEARAEFEARFDLLVETWGTPESPMAEVFSPSMAGDTQYRAWLERYCRLAADREACRDLLEMLIDFDVRDVLPEITVPTLVIHRTGDRVVPVAYGREVAAAIDGARLVEHEGDDHFQWVGDMRWLDDLEEFVTGSVLPHPPPPRTAKPRIQTLGRFGVVVGDTMVPNSAWGSRLPRQLCKRLVAARGKPVTREHLFDLFWPNETDDRKLGARLSVHLSTVRRVLGGGVIADRESVALNLAEVTTDLEELHLATDDQQIVGTYTGDFLSDDRDESWAAACRNEARSLFVTAAKNLLQSALQSGNQQQAAGFARRLIEVDPYDEAAHQSLVGSLLSSGDTTGAAEAHRIWTARLSEIGVVVEPMAPHDRNDTPPHEPGPRT